MAQNSILSIIFNSTVIPQQYDQIRIQNLPRTSHNEKKSYHFLCHFYWKCYWFGSNNFFQNHSSKNEREINLNGHL